MNLEDSLDKLPGVGAELSRRFNNLGLKTVEDLVNYFPRKYIDFSNIVPIAKARPGLISIKADIKQVTARYSRRGLNITEAIVSDSSGSMRLIWFNQPYRKNSLKQGSSYYISGDFGVHRQHLSMVNPSIEEVSDFTLNTARIVPVYRETSQLKSAQIRRALKASYDYFPFIEEDMPSWLLKKSDLISKPEATLQMHFPKNPESLEQAKQRISFSELFDLTLAALLNRQEINNLKSFPIEFDEQLARKFVSKLPFKLTDEQRRVIWQIYLDMGKDHPMNRLVEGDVGTGKTVVATMAALMVINSGLKVAFMAPTELLAKQHAETIHKMLGSLNLSDQMSLLVGSMTASQKKQAIATIKSSKVNFIVGTHSLIQDKVEIDNLGLVVIDEQHRFGVKQRQGLIGKSKKAPHMLTMSATPIPRTLQLTVFKELDVSIIKHKPYESDPISTTLVRRSKRLDVYKAVKGEVDKGHQAYVVCPLISKDSNSAFASAEKVYEELSGMIFKQYKVGLLHGKQTTDEKQKIMKDFINQKIDILVSTTIVEVGVDVPNATVMVIESADRFGLAQIHQLRGRVGRSSKTSYCYLIIDSDEISPRLRAVENTTDGFKLAELDLKIRGPGAIYGTLQHGLLDLKVAKLDDPIQIKAVYDAASEFLSRKENLLQYKRLNDRISQIRLLTTLN